MTKQRQFRRGTTADHTAFTGALAEVTVDTSKRVVIVHDGATPGGFPAQRELEIRQGATIVRRQPLGLIFESGLTASSADADVSVGLADTGVAAGTYSFATVTVDAKGRILVAASGTPSGALATVDFSGDVTGSGLTGGTIPLTLAAVGAVGTYTRVITDAKGRVVSGSNPGFLTQNQPITLSGDATGTGATTVAVTLANSGVIAGTYSFAQITVDSKGRIINASSGTAPTGSGVTTYVFRVNFANNGATPVDTVDPVPTSGPGALPPGWSVDSVTTDTITFAVPSGLLMPPNIPVITIAGVTNTGGYLVRTVSGGSAGAFVTSFVTATTLQLSSLSSTTTGATATTDNHIWVRVTV